MQKEILLQKSRTGTTIYFFNTDINENNYPIQSTSTVVKIYANEVTLLEPNMFDGVSLTANNSTCLWKRNTNTNSYNSEIKMNYVCDTYLPNENYISGKTFTQVIDSPSLSLNKDKIIDDFTASMNAQFTAGTISYVFFKETLIDDLYANIKLERTFDVLDTLNIYNKVTGDNTNRDSSTGVVFGKLEAIQKISDDNGNKIRIPLKNVPIGIFVSSNDFETANDLDEDGSRIRLNYRPLTSTYESYSADSASYYFNSESAIFDNQFLKKAPLDGLNLHPTFSNVVYTNEDGEFMLHNINSGPQILFFEVDLLKQGLTKDEVALNFFPYQPSNEDILIDSVPHYFYRAIPIDVVPSWGSSFQTGYTEVNVSVNLDLRKWTTYIFPPVSIGGERLESAIARNSANTLKLEIRDMTKKGYPTSNITVTQILNDLDKESNQQYSWYSEFAQIRNKLEFYKFGCNIVKLPSNIYDSSGFKTDTNGIPTINKGVWLSAYQLNFYINKDISRKTGGICTWRDGSTYYTKSHFDLTYAVDTSDDNVTQMIGVYPYEKPWSALYPQPYSIPSKPINERYVYRDSGAISNIDEPAYTDGDLVGYKVGESAGGFGSQTDGVNWFGNRIAQSATKDFMYKYEKDVAWNETYANGYEPSNGSYERFQGISTVVNGEKFQRLESGYGYFLKPSGWPRIVRYTWGSDTYFKPDLGIAPPYVDTPIPFITPAQTSSDYIESDSAHINDIYNINRTNIALAMDSKAHIKNGIIDIYRIINSNPNNLSLPEIFATPTFARLIIGSAKRCYSFVLTNSGEIDVKFNSVFNHYVEISTALGVAIAPGSEIVLPIGESVVVGHSPESRLQGNFIGTNPVNGDMLYFEPKDTVENINLVLPGNSNFNSFTNRYDNVKYTIIISVNRPCVNEPYTTEFNAPSEIGITNPWVIKTIHEGGSAGEETLGINTIDDSAHDEIHGIKIEQML
jgi:hypothetical protein